MARGSTGDSNYLNEKECCERLEVDMKTLRSFIRWSWLRALKTTTGYLIYTESVEKFALEKRSKLAVYQRLCRRDAERKRLRASQRRLEM